MTLISFELHLTTFELAHDRVEAFIDACRSLAAKPLLIELARGAQQSQPMLSKILTANSVAEAHDQAGQLAQGMSRLGFTTQRLKLEVSYHDFARLQNADLHYFEWHARVQLQRHNALEALCEKHRAHLSRNAISEYPHSLSLEKTEQISPSNSRRKQRPSVSTRFVTLRRNSHQEFAQAKSDLSQALRAGLWRIDKEVSEVCVYDSKLELDRGWLYEN
jgi:hypothetical protein